MTLCRSRIARAWILLLCLTITCSPSFGAISPPDEAQLVSVLDSASSEREKDAACAALKLVGTERCVPALARLLTHPELSHSARYALEPMPYPSVVTALVNALSSTSGATKAGIIHSLQVRRELSAIPALAGTLDDSDPLLARAAAEALGEIGGRDARQVLVRSMQAAGNNAKLRAAEADALLRLAQALQDSGSKTEALSIFRRFTESSWPEHIRTAAWRGVFLNSRGTSLASLMEPLGGKDEPARMAALSVVRTVPGFGNQGRLTRSLAELEPALQVAVLSSLAQRGDPRAASFILPLTHVRAPETRAAALAALGTLGNADHVKLLTERAASASGAEQAATRQALVDLHRGPVSDALTRVIRSSSPPVQAEVARVLGERREVAATPALLELARLQSGSSASAALQALGALARQQDLPAMVELVLRANSEASRASAVEALNSTVQRLLMSAGEVDSQPLLDGLQSGSPAGRAALLRVCSGIADESIRQAIRQAAQSQDSTIRTAAIAAMSDTVDPELLPDLTTLAIRSEEVRSRNAATAGIVRLWAQEEPAKVPHDEKLRSAKALAGSGLNDDQWRRLLAGLADIPDPEVLPLVQRQLGNPALKNEAARALVKLCAALPQTDNARRALAGLDLASLDQGTRTAASNTLKQLETRLAYLTSWQVTGPYRQTGKNFSELFDLPFPPEQQGGQVEWKAAQLSADPAKPYALDLLKMFGGEQCVAYARAEVTAATEADGVLEIGSDDGIKIWLNGTVVHANNTARPLQPGQDKARVHLKPGSNQFLVKLTQNNLGWEFCIKLVNQDGRLIEGVTNR